MSDLAWIASRMIQLGDWGLALKIEAHFDESGTGADEITVAGYLFESDRIGQFCDLWESKLEEYHLPYFHMVDCAHGAAPFDTMKKNERVRLQMEMMKLIKRFSVNGIVCNIQNSDGNARESYLDAVKGAANLVVEWADNAAHSGKIAYFLESGADGQGLVDGWFHEVAGNPGCVGFYRYAGHAFIPKNGNPGVQAADLLSWQYHNFTKKRTRNDLARLDLRALLRHPHIYKDECGEPPRGGDVQSALQSRSRIETVYYLPSVREEDTKGASILKPASDFTLFGGGAIGAVLACPHCYRAIAEGVKVQQIREIVFACWCGKFCKVPYQMPPFASY